MTGPPDQQADERLECRLCGRMCRSIGHHVVRAHGMTADEYRDRHGIRRGEPLTSPSSRQRWVDGITRQIAAGTLAGHYAGNVDRGAAARAASILVRRALRAQGAPWRQSRTPRSWAELAAIIAAIEAGRTRATIFAEASISPSAFYAAIARHPDLKARLAARRRP